MFTGLAAVAAASFAGSVRQLHWRRRAIGALWTGLDTGDLALLALCDLAACRVESNE